ncbi:MAG: protein kinase [Acidobacteria bacterium]|nr:protein kinase [Acidobacteriota bacterium]
MSMNRKKIGNFYLVEQIGAGGMSEVYLGINPKTREKRAYKILAKCASLSPSTYARFLREIEIIRGLTHPGIIKISDNGVLEECYYYSMEFMPGGNLNRLLAHGKMAINAAVELFMPVCAAMGYAHENGVIHRDLKPSNILLNKTGNPVISDFGIAKMLNYDKSALTQSGEILGTIAYLAPEQRFSSRRVNRRADVYALGAILYEMLMGFPPLGNFPRPFEVNPSFLQSLQEILEKCLATDPDGRYEHAGQLQAELERFSGFSSEKSRITACPSPPLNKAFTIADDFNAPPIKTDRIESWFHVLRTGTTRERLSVVREMVEKLSSAEAKAIVKIYPEEGDRVRWGLIRVLGELRIEAATPLILSDLRSSFHTECAIEALGKIGSGEAFDAIREYIGEHPESAIIALTPLAKTGKQKAVQYLQRYLKHEMAVLRQSAVQALACIGSAESMQLLKEHLNVERDEKVRSALLQAVHTVQAVLIPDVTAIQPAIVLRNARNW